MNNYTTQLIPNIIRESISTTKERQSTNFYPKTLKKESTIRDHFSSGDYTTNILKIKKNFMIKNLKKLTIVENTRHQSSFMTNVNPCFDTGSHQSFICPTGDVHPVHNVF